jgi:hypothetical protein
MVVVGRAALSTRARDRELADARVFTGQPRMRAMHAPLQQPARRRPPHWSILPLLLSLIRRRFRRPDAAADRRTPGGGS